MKKSFAIVLLVLFLTSIPSLSFSQHYVKLNSLYACLGIINPAVEFRVSDKSSFQAELVASPWLGFHQSGMYKPIHFGIMMNEFRHYFKTVNQGWYAGLNASLMIFDMARPAIENGQIYLEDRRSKGYGMMFGLSVGYEYIFKEKWLLDAYLGFAYMNSMYNGYAPDGTLILEPNRPVQPTNPDPWNGSAEWAPNKIGLSFGYRF